jgi:hypothetical protein
MRLVRSPAPGSSRPQIFEVNYKAIAHEGDATTNYRLQAGDRLIVLRDPDAEKEPVSADRKAAAATVNVTDLERRLAAVEHKLDKVIELLGGAGN